MSSPETSTPSRPLNSYEAGQVRAIAAWKNCGPSRLSAVIDTLTAPVTWAVGHVIPRAAVARLVESLELIAARSDVRRDVAAAAGLDDVAQLAEAPLETCDRLARLFSARAEKFAVIESAAASLGGPLFHMPQQLIAALRSITRIGHCYGYELASKAERNTVIDILEISMLQNPADRHRVVESLHAAIEAGAESLADEQDFLTRASRAMFTEEALDFVPVVGTAASFVFDNQFMHSVDETAQRVFQERWLRDRRLVERIAPAEVVSHKSSHLEIGRALGQGMYCIGAIIGYGVSFPSRFVQHAFGAPRNPLGVGARHGSARAVGDARDFLTGLQESFEGSTADASLADATG
ncbi:MAG: hypothetical protein RLZZ440_823 [Planctomycetota bacterium]|jgi:hypothetical protein